MMLVVVAAFLLFIYDIVCIAMKTAAVMFCGGNLRELNLAHFHNSSSERE